MLIYCGINYSIEEEGYPTGHLSVVSRLVRGLKVGRKSSGAETELSSS